MDNKPIPKTISQSTPITIALTVALCGGAMVVGMTFENLRGRVRSNEAEHTRDDGWQTQMTDLTKELSELGRDNKSRIDRWDENK